MADEFGCLRIILDHGGQRRIKRGREAIRICLNGLDWDAALSNNVWFEPTTGAVMRKPAFMDAGWQLSNSGVYQKLGTADYTFTTSASWKQVSKSASANDILMQSQDVNEAVVTTATHTANQAMFLMFYCHGNEQGGSNNGSLVEFGWGNPLTTSPTSGRIFQQSRVQVYRNDVQVYEGDNWSDARFKDPAKSKTKQGGGGSTNQGIWAGYWFEPLETGLLITDTSTGRSTLVSFADIDVDTLLPAAIPARQFWWWVRNATGATANAQASVQAAKVQYLSDPYVISDKIKLDRLPARGLETVADYWVVSSNGTMTADAVSLLNEDGDGAWDGASDTLRVKVSLSEFTGVFSGAFYAVEIEWPGETVLTDGSEKCDLNALTAEDEDEKGSFSIRDVSFQKPDAIGGATFGFTVTNPERIDIKQGTSTVRSIDNRQVAIQWGEEPGENFLIDGRAAAPSGTDSLNPEAETLTWVVTDQTAALSSYHFRSKKMLGGRTFKDALTWLFKAAGTFEDADLNIEDNGFTLPLENAAKDDCSCLCQVGDNPMEWIQRLMDDYSALDFLDIVPQIGEPVKVVYRTLYEVA